jgi:hypothetical protein
MLNPCNVLLGTIKTIFMEINQTIYTASEKSYNSLADLKQSYDEIYDKAQDESDLSYTEICRLLLVIFLKIEDKIRKIADCICPSNGDI